MSASCCVHPSHAIYIFTRVLPVFFLKQLFPVDSVYTTASAEDDDTGSGGSKTAKTGTTGSGSGCGSSKTATTDSGSGSSVSISLACLLGKDNVADLVVTVASDDASSFKELSKFHIYTEEQEDSKESDSDSDNKENFIKFRKVKFGNVPLLENTAIIPFIPLERDSIIYFKKAELLDSADKKTKIQIHEKVHAICLLHPDLVIDALDAPSEAIAGEMAEIVVAVKEIAGDLGATFGVVVMNENVVIVSESDVSVDAAGSISITLSVTFTEIGRKDLAVRLVDAYPAEAHVDNNVAYICIDIKSANTKPTPYDDIYYHQRLGQTMSWEAFNLNTGYINDGFFDWPITITFWGQVDDLWLEPVQWTMDVTYEDINPTTGNDFRYAYHSFPEVGFTLYGWTWLEPDGTLRSRFGAARYLALEDFYLPDLPSRPLPSPAALSSMERLNANSTIRACISLHTSAGNTFRGGCTERYNIQHYHNDFPALAPLIMFGKHLAGEI